MIYPLLGAGIGSLLLYAALHDLISRTIPNFVSVLLALLSLLRASLHHELVPALLTGAAMFLLCVAAWHRHLLGGGDVKLLGALSLAPPAVALTHLAAISIAGGLLAGLYLTAGSLARRLAPPRAARRSDGLAVRAVRAEVWRIRRRGALPYGVAIAAGALFRVTGA